MKIGNALHLKSELLRAGVLTDEREVVPELVKYLEGKRSPRFMQIFH